MIDTIRFNAKILFLKMMGILTRKDPFMISFIPHGGMLYNGYDIFNYKSDNALTLLHFMIEKYGRKYKYRVACDSLQYNELKKKIQSVYCNIDVACFPLFEGGKYRIKYIKDLIKSKYIFTAEGHPQYYKSKNQLLFYISYYIPFKNDYIKGKGLYMQTYESLFNECISTSNLYSYITSTVFHVSFDKFKVLGFPRDDELLKPYNCKALDDYINQSVDYRVNRVILYTPTHRDYERGSTLNRDFLGIKIDKQELESFLIRNKCVIICKLHSAQNSRVYRNEEIKGVLFYHASKDFGLCELLQKADVLITDYTSTYFDYLLLDRPVLFDFYDYNIYAETRGFSYDPLEPILAGDVVKDENTFFNALQDIIDGKDKYAEKRKFVRDLQHKYIDTKSSERICNYIFGKTVCNYD